MPTCAQGGSLWITLPAKPGGRPSEGDTGPAKMMTKALCPEANHGSTIAARVPCTLVELQGVEVE